MKLLKRSQLITNYGIGKKIKLKDGFMKNTTSYRRHYLIKKYYETKVTSVRYYLSLSLCEPVTIYQKLCA